MAAAMNLEPVGKCAVPTHGKCSCFDYWDTLEPNGGGPGGPGPNGGPNNAAIMPQKGLRVECSETTTNALHTDLLDLAKGNTRIFSLQVRDSNLRDMMNLPQQLHEIRHLTLDNTGIDLETIRESSENLNFLKSMRIYNEKFTEVPEDLFISFGPLRHLELNDVGVAAISDDSFEFLEDSLVELHLRENRLKQIPIAIQALSHLEVLDLTDNEIEFVQNDVSNQLESSLKALRVFKMNSK